MHRTFACLLLALSLGMTACEKSPILPQSPDITEVLPVGSLAGRILLPDGEPAANIIVKVFPVARQAAAFRTAGIETEIVSDSLGRFVFAELPEGELNIEAVKSSELKVFMGAVTVSKAKPINLGDLTLQPTGAITGKVSAPYTPTVKNFEGVDVFIPGSSYIAKAAADGSFTISNVSVGTFNLVAVKAGLGRALAMGVEVRPRTSTSAPSLELTVAQPEILAVTPSNAGPGAEITITGENFGASTGETFQVSFNGAIAVGANRIDDETIKLVVPSGATTGDAVVTVNGLTSNGTPFRVLKALHIPDTELLVGRELAYHATATDTADQSVLNPSVEWKVIAGSSVRFEKGKVTALSLGDTTIQASSGNLARTSRIHVFQVNGVSLDKSAVTLNAMPPVGEPDVGNVSSDTLIATVQASDGTSRRVVWTSSDPSKVTVENGILRSTRGAAEGEVTITATSVDDPTHSAAATVTVIPYLVPQLEVTNTTIKTGMLSKIVVTVEVSNPASIPLSGEVKVFFTNGGKLTEKTQVRSITIPALGKETLYFEDPSWTLDGAIVEIVTQNDT